MKDEELRRQGLPAKNDFESVKDVNLITHITKVLFHQSKDNEEYAVGPGTITRTNPELHVGNNISACINRITQQQPIELISIKSTSSTSTPETKVLKEQVPTPLLVARQGRVFLHDLTPIRDEVLQGKEPQYNLSKPVIRGSVEHLKLNDPMPIQNQVFKL